MGPCEALLEPAGAYPCSPSRATPARPSGSGSSALQSASNSNDRLDIRAGTEDHAQPFRAHDFDLACLDSFLRWGRARRKYRRDECRADRILSSRLIRAPSLAPTQQKLT